MASAVRAQPVPTASADGCQPCHYASAEPRLHRPVAELPRSVHGDAGVGCADCHGGDAGLDTARAHDPAAGFVGKPTGVEALARCGDCHADGSRIHSAAPGLRLDASALLLTSRHGVLVAAGDDAAPSCPDCHGSHDTLRGSDPSSRVHRARVQTTCGNCHSDSLRLAGHRSPTTQLDRWERSAHAVALRQGEPSAPTCTSCHGAHADAPEGSASVASRCPDCHQAAASHLQQGVHDASLRLRGLDPCLACHDAHDVPAGSRLLLGAGPGSSCARCHRGDDPAQQQIEELTLVVRASRLGAVEARGAVRSAIAQGAFVPPGPVGRVVRAELLLKPVVHQFDRAALLAPAGELDAASVALRDTARRVAAVHRLVRLAPGLVGALLVGLVVVAVSMAGRRRARQRGGAAA